MKVGDVLRLRNVRHYFGDDKKQWVEYKPIGKNDVGLFLFLGHENIDGKAPLDVMAVMDRLGWEPKK